MSGLVKLRDQNWFTEWPAVTATYGDSFLKKFPIFDVMFPFERNFNANGYIYTSAREWEKVIIVIALVYVAAVFLGLRIMKNRPAFVLAGPLKYWNLFLALFSMYGTFRLSIMTFYTYFTVQETAFLCAPGGFTSANGVSGLATVAFVYSKVFELVDTLFLILRKKPVGFLHWFHHATVLVFTWDAYCNQQNGASLFMAMNYFVHAVMYFYYYLAACGKPPAWGKAVTVIQITQMVFGTYWSVKSAYLAKTYGHQEALPAEALASPEAFTNKIVEQYGCSQVEYNAYSGLAMYVVYLYLFAEFFVKRYILGGSKKKSGAKKQE